MKRALIAAIAAVLSVSGSAIADQVFNDDVIVIGKLCAGSNCVNNQVFGDEDIRIRNFTPDLLFDDTTGGASDWLIDINGGPDDFFRLWDTTAGTMPLTIEGGSGSHSLYVADNGNVGMGTSLPDDELHIVQALGGTGLTLESTNSAPPSKWGFSVGNVGLAVADRSNFTSPMAIFNGAPNNALIVREDGDIGLGTNLPEGKLHTRGTGVQLAYFESSNGQPVQIRMRSNSQNRRFLAVNNANQVQSQVIFRNNQVRIAGPTDSGANLYAIIGPAGIATQGPVCDPGPCDKVFDPSEFTVPSIEEHAAYMWENQHLWAVGPTSPDEPFNLTQKAGGMLHELEVAHIYIEQLHELTKAQQARIAAQDERLEQQEARLSALEALVPRD